MHLEGGRRYTRLPQERVVASMEGEPQGASQPRQLGGDLELLLRRGIIPTRPNRGGGPCHKGKGSEADLNVADSAMVTLFLKIGSANCRLLLISP